MMTDREQFDSRVAPVMDRVKEELRSKQADELRRYMRSPAYILAGGVGPDGGMGAQAVALDSLNVTGEWNSKTVEDYVGMVRDELRKEHIDVTPEIEEMMIDKMVREQMPKSSIEYILRKAGSNTLFGLPQETRKTPLQREIEQRGEELYHPSAVEKGIGWGLGAAADLASMGGLGGGVVSGLKFVGADLALAHQRSDVPKVIAPGHEQEWLDANTPKQETPAVSEAPETKPAQETATQSDEMQEEREKERDMETKAQETRVKKEETAPEQEGATLSPQQAKKTNSGGWQGILTGLGLNGLGDIGRNAGYILAMLPDMLLGMFTGKTQSLGIRDNLVPIASIMAGLFVKNPLLKMTLIGLGGANLLNKAGHEQLAKQEGIQSPTQAQVRYRQYEDEQMDPRIRDAQVRGSNLIATVDGIPVTIALPEKVVDAYNQGALPLGKLANAVLERCDRLQQIDDARERFEQESRTETRGIKQR